MEDKTKTGWIKLYRSMRESFLWTDKPFSRGQAWVDLLLLVNHKDNKIFMNGQAIEVKAGQRITSLRQLAESWGWSSTKVKKFLELLQKEQMITLEVTKKNTVLTVENWGLYQVGENTENTQKIQQSNTEVTQEKHRENTEVTQTNTNKNEKKEKKEKNEDNEERTAPPIQPAGKEKIIPYGDIIKKAVSEVAYKTWFLSGIIEDKEQLVIKHNDFSISVIKTKYLDKLQKVIDKPILLQEVQSDELYKSEVI